MTSRAWNYSRKELQVDALIHIAGTALALVGAVFIVATAVTVANAATAVAASVYALTLVAALAASALYSIWPVGPTKWSLRKYDHASIYLLIAGTYTPLATAMGDEGVRLLFAIWGVALLGALLKLVFPGRYARLSIALYLGLAWSGILLVDTLLDTIPKHIFVLLLAGGVIYSAGVPFHLWQKLRFHKAIWHAFVLVAAFVHYNAVFRLILTRGSA